jgi:hypothetical protein
MAVPFWMADGGVLSSGLPTSKKVLALRALRLAAALKIAVRQRPVHQKLPCLRRVPPCNFLK